MSIFFNVGSVLSIKLSLLLKLLQGVIMGRYDCYEYFFKFFSKNFLFSNVCTLIILSKNFRISFPQLFLKVNELFLNNVIKCLYFGYTQTLVGLYLGSSYNKIYKIVSGKSLFSFSSIKSIF